MYYKGKSLLIKKFMKKVILISLLCLFSTMSVLSQSNDQRISASELGAENAVLAAVLPQDNDLIMPKAVSEAENSSTVNAISQNKEQIVIKKGRYYLNDKPLKNKELKALLKGDPESAKEYKKSQSVFVYGLVAVIAVDVVVVVATGYIVGIVPGMLMSLPFTMSSVKHQNEAIKIYNSKHSPGSNAGL
jgi:hypothetical protein